ncbi:MAG: transporter substrate-binding protein [Paenibacillus sp.]|nr:transporter substrate-binding protein [Paenibacillus sp.]
MAQSKWLKGSIAAGLAIALAGCSGGGAATKNVDNETPVTVSIFMTQGMTDSEWQELVIDPLKKKYPYITLEKNALKTIEEVVASGNIPDLITIWNGQFMPYKDLGLVTDITPYLKSNNVNLNRFTPLTLDAMYLIGDKPSELYGLPYFTQFNALYYNKDLFDRFGTSYPKDGMTWDDAIEVAKKVSRVEGGVQYRGLDYENVQRIAFPLSINYIDHKTQKANVNSDSWRLAFETAKKIVTIPNNMPKTLNAGSSNEFFQDRTLAMFGATNLVASLKEHMEKGMNPGIAQYPSYKEKPNTYGLADSHYMLITKQSKYKEAAAKVLQVLTSEEIQMIAVSKYGRLSPLKDSKFKEKFGSEMPHLSGFNLQSIFKSKPAPSEIFPALYNKANPIVAAEYIKYAKGEQDLNTALRAAEEKINAAIAEAKGK